MTPTHGRRRWRSTLSLRLRLLGWALLLLVVTSLISVVVTRQVLLGQLENRVTADLQQEAAEFRLLADGRNPGTGEPFGADLAAVADTYLARNQPRENESVLLFVGGRLYGTSSNPAHDLSGNPELVSYWTSLTDTGSGEATGTPMGSVRWLAVPLTVNEEVRGHLVVAQFLGPRQAAIERAVRLMGLANLLVIVVAMAGGYLAMGRALRPLRAVTDTARTIEEKDLSRRIEVSGSDEVADLARTFNGMVGRLERAFVAQQSFLTDVGHELRTPITIVRGHLELMGDDPAERSETIALVTDELDRMKRMVDDLLLLARAERPDFLRMGEVDVAVMMANVAAKASALGSRRWELGPVASVRLAGDGQRLTQALMQLVQNAVQFTGEGDRIALSARATDGVVRLAVSDGGVGISAEDQRRIFERFARAGQGWQRAEGAGLGLAIVSAIATAHRGTVAVESTPGAGATFTLVIPA